MRGLRTLDLGHNRLSSLPDLSRLAALEILYLPGWIADLPDLQKLDLRWNEPVLEPPRALLERGCVVLTE